MKFDAPFEVRDRVKKSGLWSSAPLFEIEKMVKQGSYGKVTIHESPLTEWYNIPEISSLIRLYYVKNFSSYPELTLEDRFCNEMLVATSRSFSLVIRQLPSDLRMVICIFYIVLRALDTIEDDMSVPLSKKKELLSSFHTHLVNSRETLSLENIGQEQEAMLLESFPLVLKSFSKLDKKYQAIIKDITRRMGHGMARYADIMDDNTSTFTMSQYNEYCYYVAGLVGEGLSNIFVATGRENISLASSRRLSHSMGVFLQKTNIIRDFLEDHADNRVCFWPSDIYKQFTKDSKLLIGDEMTARDKVLVLNAMIVDALTHLPDCLSYLGAITDAENLLGFCAIPQLMAMASLVEMYNNPKVFTGVVKIRKGLAARFFFNGQDLRNVHSWYVYFIQELQKKASVEDHHIIGALKEEVLELTSLTAGIYPEYAWMVKYLNMFSPLALLLCVLYLFTNKTGGLLTLPRLSDTTQVTTLALLFVVVALVFAFTGIPQAATTSGGEEGNKKASPKKKST